MFLIMKTHPYNNYYCFLNHFTNYLLMIFIHIAIIIYLLYLLLFINFKLLTANRTTLRLKFLNAGQFKRQPKG